MVLQILICGVNTTGNQNTTGNAATATKLQTARTINGVSFDGSANISLSPANIGCPASPTGWLTTGSNGGAITTAQLVTLLQNNGAFNTKAWIAFDVRGPMPIAQPYQIVKLVVALFHWQELL